MAAKGQVDAVQQPDHVATLGIAALTPDVIEPIQRPARRAAADPPDKKVKPRISLLKLCDEPTRTFFK